MILGINTVEACEKLSPARHYQSIKREKPTRLTNRLCRYKDEARLLILIQLARSISGAPSVRR